MDENCMWCRYGDHPDGPFCPKHGGPQLTMLVSRCERAEAEAARMRAGLEKARWYIYRDAAGPIVEFQELRTEIDAALSTPRAEDVT